MGPATETPNTREQSQTESASKNDPKPDTSAKPKANAREDLKPGATLTLKGDSKLISMAHLEAKLQPCPKGLTQAARHSDGCDSYPGLWPVRYTAGLEVGWMFLGHCHRLALFTDRLKILAYWILNPTALTRLGEAG